MNLIAKVILLNFLLISQYAMAADAMKNSDIPIFFQNNPFTPEGANAPPRGVHIISVDDQMFPDPDFLKLERKKVISEIKKNGYLRTTKSNNSRVRDTIKNKKLERSLSASSLQVFNEKEQQVSSKLALPMANVMNTPLGKATLIDIEGSGALLKNSSWTGVSRLFEDEYFGAVILEEDNFSLSEGGIILAAELVNVSINGDAGILIEERGPGGEPYTILQWANDHKSYQLKVTMSASKGESQKRLIQLAESLL